MSRIAVLLLASPVALMVGGPGPLLSGPVAWGGPALAVGGSALSPGDAKCGVRPGSHPDMPETVVILDDQLLEVEIPDFDLDDHGLEYSDMHSFGFVCWRWIEEHHGVRVRSTGAYMVTADWVQRRQENQLAALEAVIAAQDRYRVRHGKYARQVGELAGFGSLTDYGLPPYFEIHLDAANDGWGARVRATEAWSRGMLYGVPKGCYAFGGAAPEAWTKALGRDPSALRERHPMCSKT